MLRKILPVLVLSAGLALPVMSTEVNALSAEPQIFEGKDISGVLDFIDKHTLVVFDIDDTVFRSKTTFGSAEWGSRLIHAEMAKGKSFQESVKKIMPLWIKAQKFNVLALVDEKLPKLLADIRKHALGCIAFANRQPSALEITRWQLDKFGISFDKGPISELKITSRFKHPTLYQNGLLFSHDFNEKTAVFQDWMNQIRQQLGKQKAIKKVVFVDDSIKHIAAMRDALKAFDVEFVGVRYSAADEHKKTYNPHLAEKEVEILTQNISDTEIHLLLEAAGSYTDVEMLAQAK